MSSEEGKVMCGLCGQREGLSGTRRCDLCWELESRIKGNPELAGIVLARLDDRVLIRLLEAWTKEKKAINSASR